MNAKNAAKYNMNNYVYCEHEVLEMTKASEEALKRGINKDCRLHFVVPATLGGPLCSLECLMLSRAGTVKL
jgi:hypothetical protein